MSAAGRISSVTLGSGRGSGVVGAAEGPEGGSRIGELPLELLGHIASFGGVFDSGFSATSRGIYEALRVHSQVRIGWDAEDRGRPFEKVYAVVKILGETRVSDPLRQISMTVCFSSLAPTGKQIDVLSRMCIIDEFESFDRKVTDISILENQEQVRKLSLSGLVEVTNFAPVQTLRNLQVLHIFDTNLSDLSIVKDLVNLRDLKVAASKVEDLRPLRGLSRLKKLNVRRSLVEDLQPIAELTELQLVDISETKVTDLREVGKLLKLKILIFEETCVEDIEPINTLKNLEVLEFRWTKVVDLTPLKGLLNIKKVVCDKTLVKRYW